ncbi:hypothetical protein GFV12_06100 [Desulfurobacterium thermolithotrophum]|uniref:hypothetical protein n=1 Tax=Desulfurobacterium thermolithotrophum TaxID=64160 RepID=UPI0013D116B7|nr:hypothetical protein [Desulfurobacterium thermolithotrophum]
MILFDENVTKFLLSSALLIFFLLVLYYVVNRIFSFKGIYKKSSIIDIEDYKPLDKEKGFIVVSAYGTKILLGYDKNGMHKLKEWEKYEKVQPSSDSSNSN